MAQQTGHDHPLHPTISAHRVEGTAVYNLGGEWIGKIDDILIDKVSGHVVSAVMAYGGGPLSEGVTGRYPIPWECLSYDPGHKGYRVDEERLRNVVPAARRDESGGDLPWRQGGGAHWAAPPFSYSASKPRP